MHTVLSRAPVHGRSLTMQVFCCGYYLRRLRVTEHVPHAGHHAERLIWSRSAGR